MQIRRTAPIGRIGDEDGAHRDIVALRPRVVGQIVSSDQDMAGVRQMVDKASAPLQGSRNRVRGSSHGSNGVTADGGVSYASRTIRLNSLRLPMPVKKPSTR
jgi:hypothetical protein